MKKESQYLIYSGNNQDWLDSLNEKYISKVQLIYIDPPYNTKRNRGARKHYNDTFTNWEQEIFNLVDKSHKYLKDDGFFVASINQTELFTLKNVLDKIFNHNGNCFIGIFPVKIRHEDRQLMINANFHDLFEYLLIYSKKPKTKLNSEFKYPDEIHYTYKINILDKNPIIEEIQGKKVEIYSKEQYEILKVPQDKKNFRRYLISGKIATANWSGEFYENYLKEKGNHKLIKVYGLENQGNGFRWFETSDGKRKSGAYFQSFGAGGRPKLPHNFIDLTEKYVEVQNEGGQNTHFQDSKKSEWLMEYIIDITTKKNDLVMDLFCGSASTMAVCIKNQRKCISFELEEKSLEVSKNRLENMKKGKDLDEIKYKFNYEIIG